MFSRKLGCESWWEKEEVKWINPLVQKNEVTEGFMIKYIFFTKRVTMQCR